MHDQSKNGIKNDIIFVNNNYFNKNFMSFNGKVHYKFPNDDEICQF